MKFVYILILLSFHLIEAEVDRFPDGFLMGFATSSYQIEGAWNKEVYSGKNFIAQRDKIHPDPVMANLLSWVCQNFEKSKPNFCAVSDIIKVKLIAEIFTAKENKRQCEVFLKIIQFLQTGKGESIWDRLVHTHPEMVDDGTNGDIACDSYDKFEEDVSILKTTGADIYRFSIAWPRILPNGDVSNINKAGVRYYNNLINKLLQYDIQPMVTLYHWDLPQPLQDLGGWPNPIMVDYFEDYARLVFQLFGDRVKWWITFNEPFESCAEGYGRNNTAPALGMSGIADYLCAHTVIKAHARAYHIYDEEFRNIQKGKISLSLNGMWCEPLTDSEDDQKAAERTLEFMMGWFLNPIITGDYPPIMRRNIDTNSKSENRRRSRLPHFNDYWKNYIKGTLDFLGINHYTTVLVRSTNEGPIPSYGRDLNVTCSQNSSWPGASVPWLKVEPTGFRKKLNWLKNYMGSSNYSIFVTENGYADWGEINDQKRINYYRLYLRELLKAIYEDKVNVIGYIAWSIMDNFEWLSGYAAKFGVYRVDFQNPERPRLPKASAAFFKDLLKSRKLHLYKKHLQAIIN